MKRVVPPANNPYPPADARDKKRVHLVEESIRVFWTTRLDETPLRERMKRPHDPQFDDNTKGPDAFVFQGKRAECLRDLECWSRDYPFLSRITGHASMSGAFLVSRVLWVHTVPWSLKRYAERTLPPADRHYTDDYKILQAQERDYKSTSEPLAFEIAVPKLHDDEYLVDAVVEMKKKDGYFHLMHVVSDDEAGEPVLHYFEMIPIQNVTRYTCYR